MILLMKRTLGPRIMLNDPLPSRTEALNLRRNVRRLHAENQALKDEIARIREERDLLRVGRAPFVGLAVRSALCAKERHRPCGGRLNLFGRRVRCGCECHIPGSSNRQDSSL